MFWANNYVSSPHIEQLLNKEDVTLHELMDDEDILQECKSQNKKLVEYLTRSDVMEELITLTTKEPPIDIEERWRYKYPNVACELLTCDVSALNEKLAGDETLLAKLYSFIDTDQPLNPLLASFFSKTIGVLVARKVDQNWYSYQFTCLQVLEFLKSRQTCVDLLLQHLETSAIMDLILKLVTQVEGDDMRQNILNWLDSQQLVQRLVMLLSPNSEPNKHANAAELLCDMITVTRENQRTVINRTDPDPILKTLESEDTVTLLLQTILSGEKLESTIVGGIQVLLKLLGKTANNELNEGEDSNVVEGVIDNEQHLKISDATLPYLEQLHKLLIDPPYKPPVKTTTGVLESPLGNTRLHVAKLFTALMATKNVKVYETLVKLETFQTLLDLFFKYTWNNFLHTQVQLCLALAINCDFKETNDIIYDNIFIKCKLIERILEAWDKNDNKQNVEGEAKQGYMGHLIKIVKDIVQQCRQREDLDKFLKDNLSPECLNNWKKLAKIKKTCPRVSQQASFQRGDSGEFTFNSSDYQDINCEDDDFLDKKTSYSHYLEQDMSPQLIEKFGFFQNRLISEGDLHKSVEQLTTLAFTLSEEEDHEEREDMFNKICQEKHKADLEFCSMVADRSKDSKLNFQSVVVKQDWLVKQHSDSSSSDENDEAWYSTEPLSTNATLRDVNPWGSVPSEPVESFDWANFDNFENIPNENSTSPTVIIDNKLYDEMKKEATDIDSPPTRKSAFLELLDLFNASSVCDELKMETSEATLDASETETPKLESKTTMDIAPVTTPATMPDDMKVEDSVDSISSHIETNVNHKDAEDDLQPICTTDANENPRESLSGRESTCNENVANTEVAVATVQNEKPSDVCETLSNLSTAQSTVPQTDAK